MSKEKQIEEIAKITIAHCKLDNQCGSCHWKTCNECLAEVLYNAGYRKQGWISVDEIVPKKRQKCLCYYPKKDYGSKVVVDYAETDNGGFAEQFKFGKPSHWMPIPKAPKMKGSAE